MTNEQFEAELESRAAAQILTNAEGALVKVANEGMAISCAPGELFTRAFSYTSAPENAGGFQNHFQGCQMLSDGVHLVISGGDPIEPMSHLFVMRVPRDAGDTTQPRVVARVDIDRTHWHAGGIDRCGDLVAVPVECSKRPGLFGSIGGFLSSDPTPKCDTDRSLIVFYSMMEDPAAPERREEATIVRSNRKATAVAFTRWKDKYMLAVLWGNKLDFYFTRDDQFLSGFETQPSKVQTIDAPKVLHGSQCINLLRSGENDLLLVGYDNKGFFGLNINPPGPAKNRLHAFRIDGEPGHLKLLPAATSLRPPFTCPGAPINFDAGVAVDAQDDALSMSAVFHFRHPTTNVVHVARFGSP